MKVKATKHRNLIFLEFAYTRDMRISTFRYLFYPKESRETFKRCVEDDYTGGVYFTASEFASNNIPADPSKKELTIHNLIKDITNSQYGKFDIIMYTTYQRSRTMDHELCHHLYSMYPSFRKKAREIVKTFYGLDVIRDKISTLCDYNKSELTEETIAYVSSGELKIPYRHRNAKCYRELEDLFKVYKEKFLGH